MPKNGKLDLNDAMPRLRSMRRDKEYLEVKISELQGLIIELTEKMGKDTVTWTDPDSDEPQSAPIKQSSRGVLSPFKLKKLVPKDIWKEITYEEVDKKALELAIDSGKISKEVREKATIVTPGKKFIQ